MDDLYAINAAKTEFREAFNQGDACRIIAIADPDLINFSDGQPSEFGESGLESFKRRLEKLFADYNAHLFRDRDRNPLAIRCRPWLWVARSHTDAEARRRAHSSPLSLCRYLEKKHRTGMETLDVCRQRRCSGSLRAGGRPACEAKGLPRTKLSVESLAEPFREPKYPTVAY